MDNDLLSFGNIILAESGKKGILLPDANGFYDLNAGAFNVENYAGIKYPANRYIIEQMDENSDLNMRVKMGYVQMEVEHPEPYFYVIENGIKYRKLMTDALQWINRLRSFDKDNVCGLISKIRFAPEDPKDLRRPIWNFILCKPFGKRGSEFKESLDTPEHNTAVSIRTQISPFQKGDKFKDVVYWTGYDWVALPGMIHANKHMSAGCESMLNDFEINSNIQQYKISDVIERLDNALKIADQSDEAALARVGGMEALDHFKAILETVKTNYTIGSKATIGVDFADIF